MGIPLPIAYAIALDPEAAKAGAMAGAQSFVADPSGAIAQFEAIRPKPKRKKVSAYNRKYKAAFKKVAPRYKLKSGKWKAGGFKRAVKEAHKIAGGKKR